MAHLYKRYMRLLDKWPLDKSKVPDFGQYLRDQIKAAFPKGERSVIANEKECLEKLESLERLASNVYKKKYPVKLSSSSTGLKLEILNAALTPEIQKALQEQKRGFAVKLKNTFTRYALRSTETEQKEAEVIPKKDKLV